MENVEQYFRNLAEKNIDRKDIFLVDVKVTNSNGGHKVQLYIDGDQGIGIDACSSLSKKISVELDNENPFKGKLILEISSPGIDQPLKLQRQYYKNIGRKLKITLKEGSTKKGELLAVNDSGITINEEKKEGKKNIKYTESNILFENIDKAKVLVKL